MSFFSCCSQKAPPSNDDEFGDKDPVVRLGDGGSIGNTAAAQGVNEEQATILNFLTSVELFKGLSQDVRPKLAKACHAVSYKAGAVIIRQGDPGAEFFLIKTGEAGVFISNDGAKEVKVATLKAGDYFGEKALMRDEPRNATIVAESDISALKLTREEFQKQKLNERMQLQNRKAVGGGGGRDAPIQRKDPTPKSGTEHALIGEALRSNGNLSVMAALHDEQVKQLAEVAWKESVPKGKELIKQGDLQADYFYIVQEGSFEIYVASSTAKTNGASAEQAIGGNSLVSTVTKGGSFGELALLYSVARAATVQAQVDSIVWVIDRQNFKTILLKASDAHVALCVKYLDKIPILNCLLPEEKRAMAQALKEMHYPKNDKIMEQGREGKALHILIKGTVHVKKSAPKGDGIKMSAGEDPDDVKYFGEKALVAPEVQDTTVSVVSDSADVLTIDNGSFQMLFGSLEEIQKQAESMGASRKPFSARTKVSSVGGERKSVDTSKNIKRVEVKDLRKLGLLGCGGFGVVELWEHRKTGETYAMKGLSKGYIVQTGMQQSVINEKKIMMMLDSEFIIKLFSTYNSEQMLYFLMEAALGGELYAIYIKKGFHGSERHCMFYAAGVVYAFEHVHSKKIIYRDLKPENILVDEKGRFKLTDMGLATIAAGKSYTTCGTPDYFAPEMISSVGHTEAVDWWTLGILVFELMCGHPPFESANPMQIYSKVMKGINRVVFPRSCGRDLQDLVKTLCCKEPSQRLPMRPGGIANIQTHPYFSAFAWADMKKQVMDPPYKPVVKSRRDIDNFSASPDGMPPLIKYVDDGSGWDAEFAT